MPGTRGLDPSVRRRVGAHWAALGLPSFTGDCSPIHGRRDTLVISRAIIDEVLGVLAEKFGRGREELSHVAVFLTDMAESVRPTRRLSIPKDDSDHRILECAVAGGARRIVTGDKALLRLGSFEGIAVVTLSDYLKRP